MFHKISWDLVCHIESHDDVIKWKHFPRNWPFVRGINRSLMHSPHKGQWHRALRFPFICAWINGWVNNREDDEMRRDRAHYDVNVMILLGQRMYWICSNSKIPTKRYGIYDHDIYIYRYIYVYIQRTSVLQQSICDEDVCDLNRTPIVMAKHGGPCVHFFQESPLAGKPREILFHIHSIHRYQLCAKYLYPSTLLWQINGCNP